MSLKVLIIEHSCMVLIFLVLKPFVWLQKLTAGKALNLLDYFLIIQCSSVKDHSKLLHLYLIMGKLVQRSTNLVQLLQQDHRKLTSSC